MVPSLRWSAYGTRGKIRAEIFPLEKRHPISAAGLTIAFMVISRPTVIACGLLLAPKFAKAENQPDKAAVKQVTATCRAEVKEHAKYNEMSLWAQHKAVKKCVTEALAKH